MLLVILVLLNIELVDYGISQARGQLKIVMDARPNAEWLNDPDFPDSLKQKIKLVGEIKQFAFDSLGINFSENYSSMYDQKGEPVMFVVSACDPFKLEPEEFKFPIIGAFSYKGFFIRERAEKEERKLREKGLDTNIRTAGGWSTLGWFKDPILSEMLNRGDGYLTETIIHELTHGTLFVKDSLKFNENLATFIGYHGAKRFLEQKFGKTSGEYTLYIDHWNDRRKYINYILTGALKLDSLYNTFNEDFSEKKKHSAKQKMMEDIIANIDTVDLVNKSRYKEYLQGTEINNTFFMSYIRYNGEIEKLESQLKEDYGNDIKALLLDYKSKYPSL